MVIYWMRRWGRSSDTDGTAPGVAGTASSGTCRQTSPQKTHRSHLKEVEVALPLTAEPTPSSWAALEARSRNCVRAALDSGTAGCGALGEVVAGPCAEVVGRCWEAEEVVAPVVVLVGVGRGLEGATQCGWEAVAGDQTPTSRCAPSGRPEGVYLVPSCYYCDVDYFLSASSLALLSEVAEVWPLGVSVPHGLSRQVVSPGLF